LATIASYVDSSTLVRVAGNLVKWLTGNLSFRSCVMPMWPVGD
jgi:hypothetical protein